MKEVIFCPDWSKNNPYQTLLAKSLSSEANVHFHNFPAGMRPFSALIKQFPETNVIHVHWLTEIIQRMSWSKAYLLFLTKLFLLVVDIKYVQSKGVKVVWTIHNRLAHQQLNERREKLIRKTFARVVDHVIVHSLSAAKSLSPIYGMDFANKANIIPHGNYEGCYPPPSETKIKTKADLGCRPDETLILFFGALRPYKGVAKLAKSFASAKPLNTKLLIAGNAPDEDYKNEIIDAANKSANILLQFGYLEDQKLINYIEAADAVVIPFEDTLTSGSVILAMTQGKALIAPEAAKIFDCIPADGCIFYNSHEELIASIQNLPKVNLREMGDACKSAAARLNWESIGTQLNALYGRAG